MMCLTASAFHTGHGTDSRCKAPRLTRTTPVVIDHCGGTTLPAEGVDPS
jgi:hypothetical protein